MSIAPRGSVGVACLLRPAVGGCCLLTADAGSCRWPLILIAAAGCRRRSGLPHSGSGRNVVGNRQQAGLAVDGSGEQHAA